MAFKKNQPDNIQFEVYSQPGSNIPYNHNRVKRDVIYTCPEKHETAQTDLPPFKYESDAIDFAKQRSLVRASLCKSLGENIRISGNQPLEENTKDMCNLPLSFLEVRKKS